MIQDDLSELYVNWLAEQRLVDASLFEDQQNLFKELAEQTPSSPDWSTWCQTLCS
jgi:hypothetical protein